MTRPFCQLSHHTERWDGMGWTCSSSSLTPGTWPLHGQSSRCHQVPWLGCFPNTDRFTVGENDNTSISQSINLFSFGWGPTSTKISPQRETTMGAAGTNQAELSPGASVAAVICVWKCVCRGVTPLCVCIVYTYQLFCTHIWQNSHLW